MAIYVPAAEFEQFNGALSKKIAHCSRGRYAR